MFYSSLSLMAALAVLLQVSPGGQSREWCNDEIGRITFIVYGARAESYTIQKESPDEVLGPSEWVLINGEWRRTGLPARYASVAPVIVIDGDELQYSATIVGERKTRVWKPC